jgi:P-type Cu2+ transporter
MSERPDMVHDGKSEHGRSGHRGHDTAEHHSGGGGAHHAHMAADFRRRFWVSLILSIPVLALAPPIQAWLGLSDRLAFPGDRSVQAVFATIIIYMGVGPFCGESPAS